MIKIFFIRRNDISASENRNCKILKISNESSQQETEPEEELDDVPRLMTRTQVIEYLLTCIQFEGSEIYMF
jgi:hypothetical protein